MNKETRIRLFWTGKKPTTKEATEYYLNTIKDGEPMTQRAVARKFGILEARINLSLSKLRDQNLLYYYIDPETDYGLKGLKKR